MKKRLFRFMMCAILCLSSCQFKKDGMDMTFPGESVVGTEGAEESTVEEVITANLYHVEFTEEQYNTLGETLSQLIWGMTEEESLIYQDSTESPEDRSTKTWYYSIGGSPTTSTWSFGTHEYHKWHSYTEWTSQVLSPWEHHNKLPQSEIDTCTREEAIAFCEPYATALGLVGEDITIETYGIPLNELKTERRGAPYEEYEFYLLSEIRAKRDAGLEQEADAMFAHRFWTATAKESPWEKKHEAVLVVYRMHVDGVEINDTIQMAKMIYVPYYNEIVLAKGVLPFGVREVIGEETLITKKEALAQVRLKSGGINEVKDIVLTYIYLDDDEWDMELKGTLHPTWRVDYIKGGQKKSMWVDAVDGMVRSVSSVDGV